MKFKKSFDMEIARIFSAYISIAELQITIRRVIRDQWRHTLREATWTALIRIKRGKALIRMKREKALIRTYTKKRNIVVVHN